MENKIKNLKISHFKSIEEINISCKKINIFIGKPNVGKSNILEAISLLSPYNTSDVMKLGASVIRYEQVKDLFYFKNSKLPIKIESNIGTAVVDYVYHADEYLYCLLPKDFQGIEQIIENDQYSNINVLKDNFEKSVSTLHDLNESTIPKRGIAPGFMEVSEDGKFRSDSFPTINNNPIKFYLFKKLLKEELGKNRFYQYLLPPNGINLLAVLENYNNLMAFCQEKFEEYDLALLIDKYAVVNKLEILRVEKHYLYTIPYSSIADTLQRMIFHQAAIISNQNSIILFEEPEAHSFPPYIKELAESIAEDESNQYFIATHSPFILNTILENTSFENVNLFKVSYENHKTSLYKYSDEELGDLLNFGEDIFFNI